MLQLSKTIVIVSLFTTSLFAVEWKTEDETISVAVPDDSRFVQVDPIPPLSVIWVSKDEKIKLGVVEISLPRPDMKLIQSSVEKGISEEMNGKIVESSTVQQAGHEIFVMTCHSELQGADVYLTQAVVSANGKVYKLMANGQGIDTRNDSDVTKFISSIKILAAKEAFTLNSSGNASSSILNKRKSEMSLVNLLSENIGGISALILILCGIVILISRIIKGQKPTEGK